VICHVHELEYSISVCTTPDGIEIVKKHASCYIAASDAVKRNLVGNLKIPVDKICTIHGFIPLSEDRKREVQSLGRDIRQELGIAPETKVVCACGAIDPRKGPDLFLEVARRVAGTYKIAPVHFIWVGGHPWDVKAMRMKAESLSLQNIVHFVGQSQDVNAYYDVSDVFLLPSREDPFPLVMLEAAWRGKPIVCFANAGGASEFVGRDAGFVVPAFDVDEMSRRVVDLLTSSDLRSQMGATAKQRVLDHHDLSAGAAKIARIIDDTLLAVEDRRDDGTN
jgi:glycosyltransferase involved in cell wall biosynthesis